MTDTVWSKVNRWNFISKSKAGSKRCGLLFQSVNQLREHQVLLEQTYEKDEKIQSKEPIKTAKD